jgi:hypothetical protein
MWKNEHPAAVDYERVDVAPEKGSQPTSPQIV